MSRFGFLLLSILHSNDADSKYQAMTAQEIKDAENLNYELDTFYRQLRKFVLDGLVGQGAKDGKANTYYITPKGVELIEEANGDD